VGTFVVLAIALVGGIVAYIIFRTPENRFLKDIAEFSPEMRAGVLLQATLLRLGLGADNPSISDLLMNPKSFPKEDCIYVRNLFLKIAGDMRRTKKNADNHFREMGMEVTPDWERLNSTLINAAHVWIQTTLDMDNRVGAIALWQYLSESVPYLGRAIEVELERHEIAMRLELGSSKSNFLNGLPPDLVINESMRRPNLTS
jgi:hypothetical protein